MIDFGIMQEKLLLARILPISNLGFILAFSFTLRREAVIRFAPTDSVTRELSLFGFPWFYTHHSATATGSYVFYLIPFIGDWLIYSLLVSIPIILLRSQKFYRQVNIITWIAFIACLGYAVLTASLGKVYFFPSITLESVKYSTLSIGLPIDKVP